VDFVKLATALGADHVETFDPYDFDKTQAVLKAAADRPGVNVLITLRPCALFPKKLKDEAYRIVAADCNGCGVCLKIGCPAIARSGEVTAKGLSIPMIDPTTCTGCSLCAAICPTNCIRLISEIESAAEVKP
jgi:indolepyruvate ferredoxin oxidoreductase, alpha subunit